MFFFTCRKTSASFSRYMQLVNELGLGKLNIYIDAGNYGHMGELANALNTMVHRMCGFLMDVSQNCALVDSGSDYLLSRSSEKISDNVQNLTTALQEEIVTTIQEASKGLTDLSSGIQQVNTKVREGSSASAGNYVFAREISRVASDMRNELNKFDIGKENFAIGKVKAAHLAWKTRLEGMLYQGLDLNLRKIPNHKQCDFGKWIASSEGQALKNEKDFQVMMELHEQVHALAYRIAELYHSGRQEEAEKLMERFEQIRKDLFASLDRMYRVD
ncbi:MAG: CZB domain-containing protein [Desulfobulbaceae bacterium]|nr:CZB domain-containing protein [Desulfobulbaceae bacterium]